MSSGKQYLIRHYTDSCAKRYAGFEYHLGASPVDKRCCDACEAVANLCARLEETLHA